jgi:hypothetical protein
VLEANQSSNSMFNDSGGKIRYIVPVTDMRR